MIARRLRDLGIIPMYMGSTFLKYRYHKPPQNHPHVYGEHLNLQAQAKTRLESSPCIWGARIPNRHLFQ